MSSTSKFVAKIGTHLGVRLPVFILADIAPLYRSITSSVRSSLTLPFLVLYSKINGKVEQDAHSINRAFVPFTAQLGSS